jgi:hypothetical protein
MTCFSVPSPQFGKLNRSNARSVSADHQPWESQEKSVLLVSDDKVTVQSARSAAVVAPEFQRSQSQRLHQTLLGSKQRKCIQIVRIKQLQNLRALRNRNIEFPQQVLTALGTVQNAIMENKTHRALKGETRSVLTLLKEVPAMSSNVQSVRDYDRMVSRHPFDLVWVFTIYVD